MADTDKIEVPTMDICEKELEKQLLESFQSGEASGLDRAAKSAMNIAKKYFKDGNEICHIFWEFSFELKTESAKVHPKKNGEEES